MIKRSSALLSLVLSLALPSLPAVTAEAAEMMCQDQIRTFVENVGIIFDEMTNTQIVPQFWGTTAQDREVSGYWFYGQPAACPTGGIRLSLWANCEVSNAFTHGGCSIPNVPSQDL